MMCENIGLSPCAWPSVADGAGAIQLGLGGGGNGGRACYAVADESLGA
jgi:hypothetical protein